MLMPNFRDHHLQTPKDLISKKKIVFWIIILDLVLLNLLRKIGIFYFCKNTCLVPIILENQGLISLQFQYFSIDQLLRFFLPKHAPKQPMPSTEKSDHRHSLLSTTKKEQNRLLKSNQAKH